MQHFIQQSVHRGLSDQLHACIDTGNKGEADLVLVTARDAHERQQLDDIQMGDLCDDYLRAFH